MKNPSSSLSLPNPTTVLFLMAVILLWSVESEDAGPFSAGAAGFVIALLVAGIVYFLSKRPDFGVVALFAAGAMAHLYVEIFGMKARPEHIVTVLVCLALPFWLRQRLQHPQWMLPDLLLVLYVAANLVSSVVMSIAPSMTLRWAMQQALVILTYFLLRLFCTDRERFRKAFMVLLAVGAAQAAVGVFCFFSNLVFGSEFGVDIDQYGSIPGTYGLEYEANILGAISAAAFVMMLITYLYERRGIFLWGTAITFAGMMIALSRAAIVAAFIAVGLLFVINMWGKFLDGAGIRKLAVVLLITNVLLLPVVLPLYIERFRTVDISDISGDDNTAARVITIVSATDGIMAHPIMGNGTSSFQLLVSYQELGYLDLEGGTWIGNTELRVLHDTGIIGLTLLLCFLCSLALRARKILQREMQPILLALLFASVVYAITFQATEGTLLEFFWVHIGLIGCAIAVYQNSQAEPDGPREGRTSSGGASA